MASGGIYPFFPSIPKAIQSSSFTAIILILKYYTRLARDWSDRLWLTAFETVFSCGLGTSWRVRCSGMSLLQFTGAIASPLPSGKLHWSDVMGVLQRNQLALVPGRIAMHHQSLSSTLSHPAFLWSRPHQVCTCLSQATWVNIQHRIWWKGSHGTDGQEQIPAEDMEYIHFPRIGKKMETKVWTEMKTQNCIRSLERQESHF